VLFELPPPRRKPHAEVFDRSPETGRDVPGEMAEDHKPVYLRDLAGDVHLVEMLPVDLDLLLRVAENTVDHVDGCAHRFEPEPVTLGERDEIYL